MLELLTGKQQADSDPPEAHPSVLQTGWMSHAQDDYGADGGLYSTRKGQGRAG